MERNKSTLMFTLTLATQVQKPTEKQKKNIISIDFAKFFKLVLKNK